MEETTGKLAGEATELTGKTLTAAALIGGPTPAEAAALERKKIIEKLAAGAQGMFLEIGKLLYEVRENAEWSILRYESFKEYILDLTLPIKSSYSWATQLVGIYEFMVLKGGFDLELLAKVGVAKLAHLLPLARKGELTLELLQAALQLSDLDLRTELGHNISGPEDDLSVFIICPRCGVEIKGAKWLPKASA